MKEYLCKARFEGYSFFGLLIEAPISKNKKTLRRSM
jgi:hypothetical protein